MIYFTTIDRFRLSRVLFNSGLCVYTRIMILSPLVRIQHTFCRLSQPIQFSTFSFIPYGAHKPWVDRSTMEWEVCKALFPCDQQWDPNPGPFDLYSNSISIWPQQRDKAYGQIDIHSMLLKRSRPLSNQGLLLSGNVSKKEILIY